MLCLASRNLHSDYAQQQIQVACMLGCSEANQVKALFQGGSMLMCCKFYNCCRRVICTETKPNSRQVSTCICCKPYHCCRTRFYRAELRGTAAWEHDVEQGHAEQSLTHAPGLELGIAQSLPSVEASRTAGSSSLHLDLSFASKAWGSASFVTAPDGTPILPSTALIRPKAKASIPDWLELQSHLNAAMPVNSRNSTLPYPPLP